MLDSINDTHYNRFEMDKSKRSFEFRMSKKVAELTQVVHMLFTRNHEKEVEIEALKDAYEYEIQLVLADAKQKINGLAVKLGESQSQRDIQESRWRTLLDEELKSKQEEWSKKISENERILQDEKNECQNLRDLLINAQKDIEKLRQGVTEQLMHRSDELSRRDKEVERLKKYVASLEKTVKESERDNTNTVREFEKSNARLEQELTHVHDLLEENHQTKEQLIAKNRQLENDLKTLKKDFNRKISDMVSSQNGRAPRSASSTNHNDELERLRREVQRYRLELSNRDCNFNRMFSNQQPIFVDKRTGKTNNVKSSLQTQQNGYHSSQQVSQSADNFRDSNNQPLGLPQSKVLKQNSLQMMTLETTPISNGFELSTPGFGSVSSASSTPRPTSQSHLPLIKPTSASSEHRSRLKALAKPRPMSKETLFGK